MSGFSFRVGPILGIIVLTIAGMTLAPAAALTGAAMFGAGHWISGGALALVGTIATAFAHYYTCVNR